MDKKSVKGIVKALGIPRSSMKSYLFKKVKAKFENISRVKASVWLQVVVLFFSYEKGILFSSRKRSCSIYFTLLSSLVWPKRQRYV